MAEQLTTNNLLTDTGPAVLVYVSEDFLSSTPPPNYRLVAPINLPIAAENAADQAALKKLYVAAEADYDQSTLKRRPSGRNVGAEGLREPSVKKTFIFNQAVSEYVADSVLSVADTVVLGPYDIPTYLFDLDSSKEVKKLKNKTRPAWLDPAVDLKKLDANTMTTFAVPLYMLASRAVHSPRFLKEACSIFGSAWAKIDKHPSPTCGVRIGGQAHGHATKLGVKAFKHAAQLAQVRLRLTPVS